MTKQEAVAYFDNNQSKLASALGIFPEAVSQWGEKVPELRAYQLERITDGKLKAGDYSKINEHNEVEKIDTACKKPPTDVGKHRQADESEVA